MMSECLYCGTITSTSSLLLASRLWILLGTLDEDPATNNYSMMIKPKKMSSESETLSVAISKSRGAMNMNCI